MKTTQAWIGIGMSIVALQAAPHTSFADGPGGLLRQEVLAGDVFVPDVGYENKNEIVVTLDGYLPNSCYQIADTQVEKGTEPFSMIIHQFANLRTDGDCSNPDELPPALRDIVPYTLNFSLGHLEAGDYRILFDLDSTAPRVSTFNVAQAQSMAVDDYPYANVSAIEIPNTVNGARSVEATLVGQLVTTCQFIKEVKVLPEPDNYVIVLLPIVGFKTGVMCAQIVTPFDYSVRLGRLGEGRYLIHARSHADRAVTRAFSVIRPDP